MKSFFRFLHTCLFLFIPVLLTGESDHTVKISTGEWPPYISEKLPGYGPVIRIISEAFQLEEIEVEIGFFPWKRTELVVINGEFNALAVQGHTPEREEFYYFSDSIISGSLVFFHRKDMPFLWSEINDIEGYRVGGTISYDYGQELMDAVYSGKVELEWAKTDQLNLRKLANERIDLFPCNLESGLNITNEFLSPAERARLTYNRNPIRLSHYHLSFSKTAENSWLLNKLNTGLAKLKESGRYNQILEENGLHPQRKN